MSMTWSFNRAARFARLVTKTLSLTWSSGPSPSFNRAARFARLVT